ncbi:MAG: GW dipeptide domain-containing protein [Gammaproteobacteria bacterium]|nr:GW dipeptide domain-containing protein [Gammaproteobacteria bacterium]
MKHHSNALVTIFLCSSFTLAMTGIFNSAFAELNPAKQNQQMTSNNLYGKVTETMDASGYTYVHVDTGSQKVWAAGPVTALKAGDMVTIPTVMPMKNFHSKALNRDFDIIYFVNTFTGDKKPATGPASLSQKKTAITTHPIKAFEKAKDGKTIAEVHSDKNDLAGKTIRVRGQVTKFTANILNKNWLHIKDNSSGDDLTVTSSDTARLNDIVVIEGKLELNKDYGYGYLYPVIVVDAKITN